MANLTSAINIQVDSDTKKQATDILNNLGLSMSTAINIFLKQVIKRDGIPFEIVNNKPNEEMLKAVQEVKEIGRVLGLPDILVDKVPSDGLCGKTDEDNLGFSYEILDKYLREGTIEDLKIKKIIDHKHLINKFKLEAMPCCDNGLEVLADE